MRKQGWFWIGAEGLNWNDWLKATQSKGAKLGMDPKNPSSLIAYAPRRSVFTFHFTLKPMLCGSQVTALWLFPTPGTLSIINFYSYCNAYLGTGMSFVSAPASTLSHQAVTLNSITQGIFDKSPEPSRNCNEIFSETQFMSADFTETCAACMQIFSEWHWTILSSAGHFMSVHATLLIGQRSHFTNVLNLVVRQVFFPCFSGACQSWSSIKPLIFHCLWLQCQ